MNMPAHVETITTPRSKVTVSVTGRSETGHVRAHNEDSLIAEAPIFAVADGMGGHTRGDLASQAMVHQLSYSIRRGEPTTPEAVFTAITAANSLIASWAETTGIAGTTVAGLALVSLSSQADCHWMAFNIGDSRVYLWDDHELRQVTVDHSAIQELIDAGSITQFEALTHPERNVVTRAVGVETDADPDVWLLPASDHQTFLICSDGLTREVSPEQIEAVLRSGVEDPADRLLQLALDAGAHDNVTILIVDSTSVDTTPPRPGYHENRSLGFLEQTLPRI
ncbi:serine/threonine-protein phosphatase [Mycetocola zhadangensis]|uniref:Serine/threonine-protein phosphatase n=2 Tax=Mycetocola zhadangensis TaxID=1164595 RepID=A0A3L7J475_9MICO|nr:serine/threonine-protein phosphatase [Mycetocola zhadangensis]GGE82064.1 serine/threonine protein phosphatase [Mycetocola zhadangensis]